MREKIAEDAKANGRSMNAEIVKRLEDSYDERAYNRMAQATQALQQRDLEFYLYMLKGTLHQMAGHCIWILDQYAPEGHPNENKYTKWLRAKSNLLVDTAGEWDVEADKLKANLERAVEAVNQTRELWQKGVEYENFDYDKDVEAARWVAHYARRASEILDRSAPLTLDPPPPDK